MNEDKKYIITSSIYRYVKERRTLRGVQPFLDNRVHVDDFLKNILGVISSLEAEDARSLISQIERMESLTWGSSPTQEDKIWIKKSDVLAILKNKEDEK